MLVLIALCLLGLVHSASEDVIYFDQVEMQNSLRFKEAEVFSGEFPCIPTYDNGTRQLITFAIELRNDGPHDVKLGPYDAPLQILWQLESPQFTVISNGTMNLSCIRDTICDAQVNRKFFVCDLAGLSANCTTRLNAHTACQWVDLTGSSLWSRYWLRLSLQPALTGLGADKIDNSTITLDFIPRQLKRLNVASLTNSILFMIAFAVPNLFYFIVLIIKTARRNKDIVSYKTYKITELRVKQNQ